MKLREIYELAVKMGIEKDVRGATEIERILTRSKKDFDKLEEKDRDFFDQECLCNPFSDTRILYGDGDAEIKSVICGVDMETQEVVLVDRLREKRNVDLIIAHHPEGIGLAAMYQVMELQADLLMRMGIPINVAESILSSRISEVQRGMMPLNHQRAVDAARLLDIPLMCVHTAADNLVNEFMQTRIDEAAPGTLEDLIEVVTAVPEYRQAKILKAGPTLVVGDKKKRAGKVFVDFTGGTSGSAEAYQKMESAGVGTIVCMHIQEKHRENAKKHNINILIAGHMASDSLGLNLFLDQLESRGIEIIPAAGLIRVSRN
ncbi:MAG: NGG1p interacting factor NIF3 [Acidobacteriota bacterium]